MVARRPDRTVRDPSRLERSSTRGAVLGPETTVPTVGRDKRAGVVQRAAFVFHSETLTCSRGR